jgi:hypothetical protein
MATHGQVRWEPTGIRTADAGRCAQFAETPASITLPMTVATDRVPTVVQIEKFMGLELTLRVDQSMEQARVPGERTHNCAMPRLCHRPPQEALERGNQIKGIGSIRRVCIAFLRTAGRFRLVAERLISNGSRGRAGAACGAPGPRCGARWGYARTRTCLLRRGGRPAARFLPGTTPSHGSWPIWTGVDQLIK